MTRDIEQGNKHKIFSGGSNDSGKPSYQPMQKKKKTALTLSVITCLFMGIMGYEISRNHIEANTQESEVQKTLVSLNDQDLRSDQDIVQRLLLQNQELLKKTKGLQENLAESQRQLHVLRLTAFPHKHSSDQAKLALASELLAERQKSNQLLKETVSSLESEIKQNKQTITQMELSLSILTDLVEEQKTAKEKTHRKYQEQLSHVRSGSQEKSEELVQNIKETEKVKQEIESELEQKIAFILELEQDLSQHKLLLSSKEENLQQLLAEQTNLENLALATIEDLHTLWELEKGIKLKLHTEKQSLAKSNDEKDRYAKILEDHLFKGIQESMQLKDRLDQQSIQIAAKNLELGSAFDFFHGIHHRLSSEISERNINLEEHHEDFKTLQSNHQSALAKLEELERLENENRELLQEKTDLEEKYAFLLRQKITDDDSLNALNQEIENHQMLLEEKTLSIANLEAEIHALQERSFEKEQGYLDTTAHLSNQNQEFNQKITQLQDELTDHATLVSIKEQELSNLQNNYQSSLEDLENHRQKSLELENNLQLALVKQADLEHLENEHKQLLLEKTELEDKYAFLLEQKLIDEELQSSLKKDLENHQKILEEKSQSVAHLEAEISGLQEEFLEKERTYLEKDKDLSSLNQELNQKLADLDDQLKSQSILISAKEQELSDLQYAHHTSLNDLENHNQKIAELENHLQTALASQADFNRLTNEHEKLLQDKNNVEEKYAFLLQQKLADEELHEMLKTDFENHKKILEEKTLAIGSLQDEIERLQKEFSEKELNYVDNGNHLSTQNQELNQRIAQIENELETHATLLSTKEQELLSLKDAHKSSLNDLENHQKQISELEYSLQLALATQIELEQLEQAHRLLQNEKNAVEEKHARLLDQQLADEELQNNLRNDLENNKRLLEEIASSKDSLEEEIQRLQQEFSEKEQNYAARGNYLNDQNQDLNQKIINLEGELKAHHTLILTKEQELLHMQNIHQSSLNDLESNELKLAELENNLRSAKTRQAELERLEQEYQLLLLEKHDVEEKYTYLLQEKLADEELHRQLKEEIASHKNAFQERSSKISALEEENQVLQSSLNASEEHKEIQKNLLKELSDELSEQKTHLIQLEQTRQELSEQLIELNSDYQSFLKQITTN